MIIKYNAQIDDNAILEHVNKITNRIYKLLPSREEGTDWQTPLQSLIIELSGMSRLLNDQVDLFPLLCKMEALLTLDKEDDFLLFRKTIFECLSLINKIKECLV